ncbi:oxidoreductase-like protein [Neohortaea acidophila]|uniref:Oxidoreductase-like protein n=1 Tax=Neohortaea acidophila TaxID=245834 RepID=A0A6A6Q716_9PEZI|nr:oxidoreductase-like protein [Neohortaea acidophila]KAF2487784.1 oxidoreductase-like protein [Neohortaea acidophila]
MAGKKRKATEEGGSAVKTTKKTKTTHIDEDSTEYHFTRDLAPDLVDNLAARSACQAVINTTELLEQILLRLPITTLYGVSRVCHRFYDVMQNSKALRQRMWLQMEDLRELNWIMPPPPLAVGPREMFDEGTVQKDDPLGLARKFMPAKLNPLLGVWGDSWQTFYSHVAPFVPCHNTAKRLRSNNTPPQQKLPFEGYYEDLLDAPLHSIAPQTKTQPAPPPPEDLPKTEEEEKITRARIVFGSRLAGPGERKKEIRAASQNVAGILVPPRPEEPDNCCMSGCVNCVWDMYRDELEEWAEQSSKARVKLQQQRRDSGMAGKGESDMPGHVASSMDEDGGGSEAGWKGMESFGEGGADLFAGIPVGIREFMKTEKMLKERHKREQAAAG